MKRRYIWVFISCIVLIVILIAFGYLSNKSTSNISWSPTGDWIAFSCSPPGNIASSSLFIVRPDGQELQRLTEENLIASLPAWSPDGQYIAFVNDKSLYKMYPNGTGVERILDNEEQYWDTSPSWSPDGVWIAFVSNRSGLGKWGLYKVRTDGTGLQELTSDVNLQRSLTWSPDGQWVVFAATPLNTDESIGIYKIQADGKDQQRLTEANKEASTPSFSPDGKLIIFSLADSNGINLYQMTLDGMSKKPLSNTSEVYSYPKWSPDGGWVIFSANDTVSGLSQIFKFRLDSPSPQLISDRKCNAIAPTWFSFHNSNP